MTHHTPNRIKVALSALALASLAACSTVEKRPLDAPKETAAEFDRVVAMVAAARESAASAPLPLRDRIDAPRLSGETERPVARAPYLPTLNRPLEVDTKEIYSLEGFTAFVTKITGVPIRLDPDVGQAARSVTDIRGVTAKGTVFDVLQAVANSKDLHLRIEPTAIVIHRFETAHFRSRRPPGTIQTTTSLGTSGGTSVTGAAGATGSATSAGNVAITAMFDPWKELQAAVDNSLTPAARKVFSPSTGSIIVTDTPAAVARVRKLIETDNLLATTPITARVEVVSLVDNATDGLGLDLNVVFARMLGANSDYRIDFASPNSIVGTAASTFRLTTGPGSTARPTAGSEAFIQALADHGQTTTLLRRDFSSLHNVPAVFARGSTKGYRAATNVSSSTTVVGGTTNPTPQVGVSPGSVTTGTRILVTPTWAGDDLYTFNVSFDDSFLREIRALGVGAQQIDAPETDSTQSLNTVALRRGYTTIINAFETATAGTTTRGVSQTLTTQRNTTTGTLRFYMLVTVLSSPF